MTALIEGSRALTPTIDESLQARLSTRLAARVNLVLTQAPAGRDFHEVGASLRPRGRMRSVSYALPWVAALGADCAAVGVDIEPVDRAVDGRVARFVRAEGEPLLDLLTLWTIKEAAYKADPVSRDFTAYVVTGDSCHSPSGKRLRIATLTHQVLRISAAVLPDPMHPTPEEAR